MLNGGFKIILRVVLTLLSVVGFFVRPFLVLYGCFCTPKRKLPPFRESLLEIPAVDLAEKIRNREVSECIAWTNIMQLKRQQVPFEYVHNIGCNCMAKYRQ